MFSAAALFVTLSLSSVTAQGADQPGLESPTSATQLVPFSGGLELTDCRKLLAAKPRGFWARVKDRTLMTWVEQKRPFAKVPNRVASHFIKRWVWQRAKDNPIAALYSAILGLLFNGSTLPHWYAEHLLSAEQEGSDQPRNSAWLWGGLYGPEYAMYDNGRSHETKQNHFRIAAYSEYSNLHQAIQQKGRVVLMVGETNSRSGSVLGQSYSVGSSNDLYLIVAADKVAEAVKVLRPILEVNDIFIDNYYEAGPKLVKLGLAEAALLRRASSYGAEIALVDQDTLKWQDKWLTSDHDQDPKGNYIGRGYRGQHLYIHHIAEAWIRHTMQLSGLALPQ